MSRSLLVVSPIALLGLASTAFASVLPTTQFIVNTALDLRDATPLGDGVVDCDLGTPGDQISLRGAIEEANALAGPDSIILPAGIYDLTRNGAGENLCATGDLDVRDDLSIIGDDVATTIIDAHSIHDRLFDVVGVDLILADLTLRRGSTATAKQKGGAMYIKNGVASLNQCRVTDNSSAGDGGGIFLQASQLGMFRSQLDHNTAGDDGGGLSFSGQSSGSIALESTIFSNTAHGDGGAVQLVKGSFEGFNATLTGNSAARGGAASLEKASALVLYNCTVAKNTAPKGSGMYGFKNDGPTNVDFVFLGNTIVANNAATNYSGDFLFSIGHNLDSGSTCKPAATGDLFNKNPKLGLLKANGGPTPTMALGPTSAALDSAEDGLAGVTDQRGLPRFNIPGKGTTNSDIGAFERQTP